MAKKSYEDILAERRRKKVDSKAETFDEILEKRRQKKWLEEYDRTQAARQQATAGVSTDDYLAHRKTAAQSTVNNPYKMTRNEFTRRGGATLNGKKYTDYDEYSALSDFNTETDNLLEMRRAEDSANNMDPYAAMFSPVKSDPKRYEEARSVYQTKYGISDENYNKALDAREIQNINDQSEWQAQKDKAAYNMYNDLDDEGKALVKQAYGRDKDDPEIDRAIRQDMYLNGEEPDLSAVEAELKGGRNAAKEELKRRYNFSDADLKNLKKGYKDSKKYGTPITEDEELISKYDALDVEARHLLENVRVAGDGAPANGMQNKYSDDARQTLSAKYGLSDDEITILAIYQNRRRDAQMGNAEFATEMGQEAAYDGAVGTIASLGSQIASGPASLYGLARDAAENRALEKAGYEGDLTLNRDNPYYMPGRWTKALRQQRGENLDEYWNEKFDTPGKHYASFIYQTVMSGADSVIAAAIGAKLPAVNFGGVVNGAKNTISIGAASADAAYSMGAGGLMLGLGAGVDNMVELADSGASYQTAVLGGLVSGATEMIFEDVSISRMDFFKNAEDVALRMSRDNIKNGVMTAAKKILGSAVTNASEEGLTEIANLIYDTYANGGMSTYAQIYEDAIANGLSPAEAKDIALKQMTKQVLEAAAGGALMGAAFGAGNAYTATRITNATDAQNAGYIKYANAQKETLENAKAAGGAVQGYAERLAKKRGGESNLAAKDYGKIATEIQRASAENSDTAQRVQSVIEERREGNKKLLSEALEREGGIRDKKLEQAYYDNYSGGDVDTYARNFSNAAELATTAAGEISRSKFFEDLNDRDMLEGMSKAAVDAAYVFGRNTAMSKAGAHNFANLDIIKDADRRKAIIAEIAMIDEFGKQHDISFSFVDSIADRNAFYRNRTGSNQIIISVEAEHSSGLLTRTAGHEIFHWLEQMDKDGGTAYAQELKDFIMDYYKEAKGEEWIDNFFSKAYSRYSEADRISEFAADHMFSALTSERAVNELVERNPSLGEQFRAHIEETINFFKNAIEKLKNKVSKIGDGYLYEEIREMEDNLDVLNEINNRFLDAIDAVSKAKENKNAGAGTQEQATTGAESQEKFSSARGVEETKDLVAVHNLTGSELEKTFSLGGFPMPSIAVIKARQGHSEYGDISVVFEKSAIDPQASNKNKVYGGDAWTPTFPSVEYKPNENVSKKIHDAYYELSRKYGYDSTRPLYNFVNDMERQLKTSGGEEGLKKSLYDNTEMMRLFDLTEGKEIEDIYKEDRKEMPAADIETSKALIDRFGAEALTGLRDGTKTIPNIRKFADENASDIEKIINSDNINSLVAAVRKAITYIDTNGVTVNRSYDHSATQSKIIAETDQSAYKKWIDNLFTGIEEKQGIYNGKEYVTDNGRRSWEALHYEVTLENIVKVMAEQANGEGALFSGLGIWGAAAKEYNSIKEIKADSDRLQVIDDEEYAKLKQEMGNRLSEIAESIRDKSEENYFISEDNAMVNICDAVRTQKTKSGIKNYLSKYHKNVTDSTVDDIVSLVNDIASMPTGYFEAKPQRAVGFDEINAVIIPSNASDTLRNLLVENNVKSVEYEAGNDEDRLEKLNSLESAKFSTARGEEKKYVANSEKKEYNNDGDNYERTDEFRRIQKANQRAFNKTPTPFQRGSREINEALRTRLSDVFRRELERSRGSNGNDKQYDLSLDNGKGETFNIYQNADSSLFHDIFEISRNYLENGELVDLHPVKTTEDSIGYEDCECYISDDGLSGFAITPDGDLISVYNANTGKKGFLKAVAPVVKEKALTLDCYMSPNQPLSSIYSRTFGFKTASEMAYNMEYDHDDIAQNHSMPSIAFMVNTDANVETRQFGKNEYEEAIKYRDSFIKDERTVGSDSALSDAQNAPSTPRGIEDEYLTSASPEELAEIEAEVDRRMTEKDEEVVSLNNQIAELTQQRDELLNSESANKDEITKLNNRIGILKNKLERRRKQVASLSGKLKRRDAKIENLSEKARAGRAAERRAVVAERAKARQKETAEKQKQRAQVLRITKRISKKLLENSNKNKVIEPLKPSVTAFVKLMTDLDTFDAKKTLSLVNALNSLNDSIKKSEDPEITTFYDEAIAQRITDLTNHISAYATHAFDEANRRDYKYSKINLFNVEALKDIKDVAKYIEHIINMSNKAFSAGLSEDISEMGRMAASSIGSKKQSNLFRTKLQTAMLKPITFFDMMGDRTMSSLYGNIREGENKWARVVADARQFRIDTQKKHNYDAWKDDTITLALDSGNVELSIEDALSLYATIKRSRDQGKQHLLQGGFTLDSQLKITKLEKLKNATKEGSRNYIKAITARLEKNKMRLTVGDMESLINQLSAEQKAYADEMVGYLSDDMAQLGNEVTLRLYGVRKYLEDYYYPITSDPNAVYESGSANGTDDNRIKHMSMTKPLTRKANNPLIIAGFTDTVMRHCSDMGLYYGLALPMEDFTRVWNYKGAMPYEDDDVDIQQVNLRDTIENTYSENANAYIKQLLQDINGRGGRDAGEQMTAKFVSMFKKNAVFGSMSVAVQQPSAIMRAARYINFKYLVETIAQKRDYEELKKWAPVAIVKEMGYFDTGVGRNAVDWMNAEDYKGIKNKVKAALSLSDSSYRDDLLSRLPSWMDEITWAHLWNACKAEIADTTDLEKGSDEFYEAAAKRFTYIVDRTQVYDSVFSRSQWMRSKGIASQMATAFMAEPTTALNMLYNGAFGKLEKGETRGEAVGRSLTAFIGAVALNNALKAIVTAARHAGTDDEKDDPWLELYIKYFVEGTVDDLILFNYIPYLKDFMSMLKGYDSTRMDTEALALVAKAVNDWNKKGLTKEVVKEIANALGTFTGIPVSNIWKDIVGASNIFTRMLRAAQGNAPKLTAEGASYAASDGAYTPDKKKQYGKMIDSYASGNTKKVDKLQGYLEYHSDSGSLSQSYLSDAIKDKLLSGKMSREQAINALLKFYGYKDGGTTKTAPLYKATEKVDEWLSGE